MATQSQLHHILSYINVVLIFISIISFVGCAGTQTASTASSKDSVSSSSTPVYTKEFTAYNLTSALQEWDTDLAIMFYAPWCKYCKQLAPSLEQIASLMSTSKDVVVGKFNCEQPATHADICVKLGVDRYPSIYYIGYGDFNQIPAKGWLFSKNPQPRIVRYTADLYPEAIYDWIIMLSKISWFQRTVDDFKGFFTGNNRLNRKLLKLQPRINYLESKLKLYAESLEKYKADELFDSLADNGDPFLILTKIEPTEKNLAFRVCVAEMASEFCKYHAEEEPYCKKIDACAELNLEPKECRPAKCPFKNQKGCKVVSACLQEDVLAQYMEALGQTTSSKTQTQQPQTKK